MARPNASRHARDLWTEERPDPLEILSRLAGNTTFRLPSSGGRANITIDDISHALGCVDDELASLLALAIATGNRKNWAKIHRLAYPKLIGQLLADRRTRLLVSGANRFRARLLMYDAFRDLLAPRDVSWAESAKLCRMKQATYRQLHHAVTGFLRTEAVEAAYQACSILFGGSSS